MPRSMRFQIRVFSNHGDDIYRTVEATSEAEACRSAYELVYGTEEPADDETVEEYTEVIPAR